MVRAFDQKFRCLHFVKLLNARFNTECPSLDKRVRWCYENIPEDRLWDYDYKGTMGGSNLPKKGSKFSQHSVNNPAIYNGLWNITFCFEEEADAMAFVLVWG